jgi:hypothetical protein
MNPSASPAYTGAPCSDVIWGALKSISVATSGASGFSWSNPDGSSCSSSSSSAVSKTFEAGTDFTATASCCGCGYSVGALQVQDDAGASWSYDQHPASGPDVNQSGTSHWEINVAFAFRANPDTGACEFAVQISGGITGGGGGPFNACGFPPVSAGQSPWLPISGIIGAHTVTVARSFNQPTDGFSGADNISATVTLSA